MDGLFQDGWLHVIWKWNKSICAWEYGIRVGWMRKVLVNEGGGWGCGRDGVGRGSGVVVCIAYWRCLKDACSTVLLFVERSCICSCCGMLIFVCICVGGWILFGCVRT